MITREFDLYLHEGHSTPLNIVVNQSDHSEEWVFTLYQQEGITYEPSTGTLVGKRSDGTRFSVEGTVNNGGQIVINQTADITSAKGKAVCELRIDSDTHGTANFYIDVEKSPSEQGALL